MHKYRVLREYAYGCPLIVLEFPEVERAIAYIHAVGSGALQVWCYVENKFIFVDLNRH